MAVYMFFILSGLLVTNSLLESKNIYKFVLSRFFRIVPALLIVLILSALIVGPIFSEVDFNAYIKHPVTYDYIFKNLYFDTSYQLPGLFEKNPSGGAVNGSLWTIHYEVKAYFFLCVLYLLGALNKKFALVFLGAIVLDVCATKRVLFSDVGAPMFLALDFTFGVVAAHWKEKIIIDIKLVTLSVVAWLIFKGNVFGEILLHIMCFIIILYLSNLLNLAKFKPKYDISYGVYLYGFVTAQLLVLIFPNHGFYWHQYFTIIICLFLGFLSSILIERPMIRLGKKLSKNW
jgi:peptidoglycan/LPS O-acetylase OafA/YrhL